MCKSTDNQLHGWRGVLPPESKGVANGLSRHSNCLDLVIILQTSRVFHAARKPDAPVRLAQTNAGYR